MSNSDNIVLIVEVGTGVNDDETIVVGANSAFCRVTGFSEDEIIGRSVIELLAERNQTDSLMMAFRGVGSFRSELKCFRADGSSFMLGMHLMPAPARTAGKRCFVILGRDITEQHTARQLQDSIQRMLAKVFSSVDAAVAIVDINGRIVMTNPSIDLLLGYRPNGLVGMPAQNLLAPSSRSLVMSEMTQHTEEGSQISSNAQMLRADGSEMAARITSVVVNPVDSKKFRIITILPKATMMSGVRTETVGQIKLVGLDEVRAELGDRWPALAKRAMATAEAVIKRHCGPKDSYSRTDETTFVICFGALNEAESSFRAAMIGREIRTRLIGQGESADSAHVRSIAATVQVPNETESRDALNAVLLNKLNQQLGRIEREGRKTLGEAFANADCDLDPVFGRTSLIVATQVLMPYKLERQIACGLAVLPPKEASAFDPDGLLIRLAAQHAVASLGEGDNSPLLVKISFDLFATRAATERFFAICAKIDRRVTARLVLLLSSLPPGLPTTRLQDCVNRLRPFCQGVGYEVDKLNDLAQIDLSHSYNAIVVLPGAACTGSTPDKLRELFNTLRFRKAKIFIRGVASEREAAGLRALGADMTSIRRQDN